MNTFSKHANTDDVLAGHGLTGLTVFITGANSELGQETARAMAARGARRARRDSRARFCQA